MKILALANQKGGVGKSAICTQLAYHAALKKDLRVLVVDLDHQNNTGKAMMMGGKADVASFSSSQLLCSRPDLHVQTGFVVVPASDAQELRDLEKSEARHSEFATNLKRNLKQWSDSFDLCLIDTNPSPDIRQLSALVVATHVLSPVEMAIESIDGIAALLADKEIGIKRIQATVNPGMKLIGILPNKVDPTPFQKENFKQLVQHYSELLISMEGGGFAAIKKSTAIVEAQAVGLPVWELKKTSARDAYRMVESVFEKILADIGLQAPREHSAMEY